MPMMGMRSFLRDAWHLAKPYWRGEDWRWAWLLLGAVIALNLASIGLAVAFNYWTREFYNALQHYDWAAFWRQVLIFVGLATSAILIGVYQTYLLQMLQIRWRRWLTTHYLDAWLGDHAHYRMRFQAEATDNPDQRIADDLERFTRQTLFLGLSGTGILNSVVTLFSFLGLLWSFSGTFTLPPALGWEINIPGDLVWFAILYALVGTWITFRIGRPLIGLNFDQQRFEADFRFSLARFRENGEAIALYRGEGRERRTFLERFGRVMVNFRTIMARTKLLNWYTITYAQIAIIFPYLALAHRYFAKVIEFGDVQQTIDAFAQVQQSLSFIINSYTDLAELQSVVRRLKSFEERCREARAGPAVEESPVGAVTASLDLDLPQGLPLLRGVKLEAKPHDAVLINGPNGAGKSTLLRALAGLWPFRRGRVALDRERALFLPQRPYLPLGTLREALLYPSEDETIPDAELKSALHAVGLGALDSELGSSENWGQRLSLGEQQRLAFARVLLMKPAVVFLDEASSALDETAEAALYRLVRQAPWRPTVVSVGHRDTLRQFHDSVLELG